ncbi:MAG: ATP-binding cassette domain-containing protein [Actinomycetaceae bacterium]|nr:ATP-binding cassette domain-containing protein [Actinomycetaceae bacterium]
MITVKNIKMAYNDDVVIDGLDISVASGEIVALTGPSGCGKSTLLRGLAGYQSITTDEFAIDGTQIAPNSQQHREAIFSVFNEFSWIHGLTVLEHIELPFSGEHYSEQIRNTPDAPAVRGGAENALGKRTVLNPLEALELVGLADEAEKTPYELGIGQLQRAKLATIFVRDWQVLLLDTPDDHMSTESQELVAGLIKKHVGKRCAIIVPKDESFVTQLGGTVMELSQ